MKFTEALCNLLGVEEDPLHSRGVCSFGGGGNSTTTQKADPWSGQQGYLIGNDTTSWAPAYGGQATSSGGPGTYNAAQALYVDQSAWPSYYPSSTYQPLTSQQQGLMSNLINATGSGGSSALQSANQSLTNQLSPNYTAQTQDTFNSGNNVLNSELQSSYLDPRNSPAYSTAMSNAMASAIPAATSSFISGNRSSSGLGQAAATRAAINAAGGLAQQQYNTNQGIQQQAAQQSSSNLLTQQANQTKAALVAPTADQQKTSDLSTALSTAGMSQTDLQNQITEALTRYNYGQSLPWNMLQQYTNAISGAGSPGGTTTTTQPNYTSTAAQIGTGVSTAASLAAMVAALNTL